MNKSFLVAGVRYDFCNKTGLFHYNGDSSYCGYTLEVIEAASNNWFNAGQPNYGNVMYWADAMHNA